MIEKFIEYTGTDGNKCRVYLYSRVAVSHAEKTYVGTAIKIDEATSIFRNTHRRVCSVCRHPIVYSEESKNLTLCPMCGGVLKKRLLDTEEIMKTRVKEYKERTEPIFSYLQNRGYKVVEVGGEDSPDGVARNIINYLNGQIEN